mgnify:CR=1 FL=1
MRSQGFFARGRREMLALLVALSMTTSSAFGALSLLPVGPRLGTHVGNLVVNGSFEIGAPLPGPANYVFWATGTTNVPFGVPLGWTTFGPPSNYAYWGSDGLVPPSGLAQSDILPDGQAAVYFGNNATLVSLPPVFLPTREVTFASAPVFSPMTGGPVVLRQTVPTHLSPAPSYLLSFWVSGEAASLALPTIGDGLFGLRVTNVLAGDPIQYFAVPSGSPLGLYGASTRYEFLMTPLNPSLPIDIEFYNWGHLDLSPFGGPGATEIVLDDVIVNPVPEPSTWALFATAAAVGLYGFARRRRP